MERLGGLIHRMPATAVAFLIGCAAISALPPLNGFVSEWLTFQAILVSPQMPQWGLKFLIPAVGALLALSAALAAACFVKAFGVTFLGRPRTPAAEAAREVDRFSLAAMFVLAALCFLAGVLPGFVIDLLAPVVQRPGRRAHAGAGRPAWLSIVPIAESRSSYNGLIILLVPRLLGRAHRDVHPSLRDARDAAQRHLGLRLSGRLADHAVHQLELRHADPARVRHDRVSGAREGRHAAAGRRRAPRIST